MNDPISVPDPITDILSHFRHEHLPARFAAVSRRVGDVARDLVAGAPELAAIRLFSAGHELAQVLPAGHEKAEGLALLADAADGLPGDAGPLLRGLADEARATLPTSMDPDLLARLRTLLRAKDALVRAEVSRPQAPAVVAGEQPGMTLEVERVERHVPREVAKERVEIVGTDLRTGETVREIVTISTEE